MSKLTEIWAKICRKWMKIRLRPIHVLCFHHVSEENDAETMSPGDWMQIDEYKKSILNLQKEGFTFISLSEANKKNAKNLIRCHKYIVITFDDGYATLKEILPWLEEQQIPVTLFVNGKYLDGVSYRENPKEKYLTRDELYALTSPLVEIGSHGWEHKNAHKISEQEFEDIVVRNIAYLSNHPRFIPFHAYTWGRHNQMTDDILKKYHVVPVLMDGLKNYNDDRVVHRELLELMEI